MLIAFGLTIIIIVFVYFGNTRQKNLRKNAEEFWQKERRASFVPRKDISGLDYLSIAYHKLPLHYWQPGDGAPVRIGAKKKNEASTPNQQDAVTSEDAELSMTMDFVENMMGTASASGSPATYGTTTNIANPDYQIEHMAPMAQEIADAEFELCALAQKKILNLTGISNTDLRLAYGTANLDILASYDSNFTTLIRQLQKWGTLLLSADQKEEARTVLEYAVEIGSDIASTFALLGKLYSESREIDKIEALRETAEGLETLMKPSILRDLDALLNKATLSE